MPDALVIKDVSTMKALADPARLQILLELSARPKTVKEVAGALDVPATRLYYHFKMLERARLIRVASKRMVSGIEERTYQATATSWTPAPDASSELVGSGLIDALVKLMQAELELAIGADPTASLGEADSPVPVLSLTRLALNDDDVAGVQRRIEGIMEEFGTPGPAPKGKRLYGAMFAAYETPSQLHSTLAPDASGSEEEPS
jgi:DNA-binding transcriptional ArsR family regulator